MPGSTRTLADLDLRVGNLALDFANTVNSRTAFEHDYIESYGDLVAWADRAGVASAGHDRVAVGGDPAVPGAIDPALRRSQRLRDAIYGTFSAIAAGESPPAQDVRTVLRAYGQAVARGSLATDGDRPTLHWTRTAARARITDPIAYEAGALLLMPDRPLVKECPGCGWLFLDNSRNGSRRWCDMRVCGSRAKMRRYRSRSAVSPSDSS